MFLRDHSEALVRRVRVFSTGETQGGYCFSVQLNRVQSLTAPVKLENHPNQEVAEESWRVYISASEHLVFLITHFRARFKSIPSS